MRAHLVKSQIAHDSIRNHAEQGGALGWSVMTDQKTSGAIMWVPAGLIHSVAIMVLRYARLDRDARTVARESVRSTAAAADPER